MNTLDRMKRLYSRKYGLVNSVYTQTDIRPSGFAISTNDNSSLGNIIPMCAFSVMRTFLKGLGDGGGSSLDFDKSKKKAYGEHIERSCARTVNNKNISITFESQDSLVSKNEFMLDFRRLIHFEEHFYEDPKFPLSKYYSTDPIQWVKGYNYTKKNYTWIPAQSVFLYSHPLIEKRYVWGLSTGLSCGKNFIEASISSILEVIERDSFMLTWHIQIPGKRIEMDMITNEALLKVYRHIIKHLSGEDKLYIYDISKLHGVYTMITYIRNDLPNSYGLIIATASHLDPQIAMLKSLEELCQTQAFAYHSLLKDPKRNIKELKPIELDTLHKHFHFYSTGKHSHAVDFISVSDEVVNLSDMKTCTKGNPMEDLKFLAKILEDNELDVYLTDITTPEVINSGFNVVKAIIPDMVDLDSNYLYRQTNNKRLKDYFYGNKIEINDNPHPFP